MKTLMLLHFAIIMIIMMGTNKTFTKQQKSNLAELSNTVSGRSTRRTEREKKINKGFEWIIEGVNILGQVDNFISERTKNIIQKLHVVYNENDADTYRNLERLKGKHYDNIK